MKHAPDLQNKIQLIIDNELKKNNGTCTVLGLLAQGQKSGIAFQRLWSGLKDFFSNPDNQNKWTDWKSLDEREEIRLRLKILRETGVLHDSMVAFVIFFFRASDALLYQLSAIIMGRQLNEKPELGKYFNAYCKHRNISTDAPVRLNNNRTRRRILLVLCASSKNHPQNNLPFEYEAGQPLTDADFSILFLACSLLMEAGSQNGIPVSKELLKLRFTAGKMIQDKRLVRNAGLLLVQLSQQSENTEELCRLFFREILNQYTQADNFAGHLQVYFLLDELMEIFVKLNVRLAEKSLPPRLASFCSATMVKWIFHFDKSEIDDLKLFDSEPDFVAGRFFKIQPFKSPGTNYQFFSENLLRISDSRSWFANPVEERAAISFFLVEYCFSALSYNRSEVRQLYKSCELIGDDSWNDNLLAPLFGQLLKLEPSLGETFCDPQLIHRLNDTALLAALLPTEADTELLPVIADSAEHLIRFRIFTDSNFNPDYFLSLLSVRRPNVRFYRFLAELSNGREYPSANAGNYPLHDVSRFLIQGYSAVDNNDVRVSDLPAFYQTISSFRKELEQGAAETNPHETLRFLVRQLRGTGAEKVRDGITLMDLAEIIQPRSSNWLQTRVPAITPKNGQEVLAYALDIADKLEEKTTKADPVDLNPDYRVSETVQGIRFYLDLLEKVFVPLFGKMESHLFSNLIKQSSARISEWEQAYDSVLTIWQQGGDTKPEKVWNDLLNTVCDMENESIQVKMLSVVMETLLAGFGGETDDNWLRKHAFLEWALRFDARFRVNTQMVWLNKLRELWLRLAEEAMKRNAEARVVQLVRNKAFHEIRRKPESQEMLAKIRKWCISRYDIFHAYECNRHMNEKGTAAGAMMLTIRQYAAYYTPVWLALLVGVIFMFDFGDPWFELAEIGDVGGVIFAFCFGVAGTFFYVWSDLNKKTVHLKGDPFGWVSNITRVSIFLVIAFVYTAMVVGLFWYMFSSTEQVIHGPNALLHLVSWTGFALFVGVFLGLLGNTARADEG